MIRRAVAAAVLLACGAVAPAAPAVESTPQPVPRPSATAAGEACTVDQERLVDQEPAVMSLLGVSDAWKLSRGGVVVAIVDTGVDATNVHLGDVVLPGTDLDGKYPGTGYR